MDIHQGNHQPRSCSSERSDGTKTKRVSKARGATSKYIPPLREERFEQRAEEIRKEKAAELVVKLRNPLGEKLDYWHTRQLPKAFVEVVSDFQRSYPIYKVIFSKLSEYSPVLALALLAPEQQRFKVLLRDIRQDYASAGKTAAQVEAQVWGVPEPTDDQILALKQRLIALQMSKPMTAEEAAVVVTKVIGVKALQNMAYQVRTLLHSWSPEGVWNEAQVGNVSADEASRVYIDHIDHCTKNAGLGTLIPITVFPLVTHLAAILWNARRAGGQVSFLHGSALQSAQMAQAVCEAAFINRSLSERDLQAAKKSVLAVLNPKSVNGPRALDAVERALGQKQKHPQATFVKTILTEGREGRSLVATLRNALESVSDVYSMDDVRELLGLESSLPIALQPSPGSCVADLEGRTEEVLKDVLDLLRDAFADSFMWKMHNVARGSGHTIRFTNTQGNCVEQVIDATNVKKLRELSTLLAGIPRSVLYSVANTGTKVQPA